MKTWRRIAAVAVVGMTAAAGLAGEKHRVAWSKIEVGAWTLTPVYVENNNGEGKVDSFVAIADDSELLGDNLVAVWYIRDGDEWSAKSWTSGDARDAIKHVKTEMKIPDSDDERWEVAAIDDPAVVGEVAQKYMVGVLADDPLADEVANSPDRDTVIKYLTSIGYAAADVPLELADGCVTNKKLNGMAAAINETLNGDEKTMVSRSMNSWIASGTATCGVGSVAVEIVTFPIRPTTPWAPPLYGCKTEFEILAPDCWSTCQTWVETRTVTQKRTRARMNPTPPPTYQYCDQTNTGIETRTTTCCVIGCITLVTPTVTPCPTIPPGTTPGIGTGCAAGSTPTTTTTQTWAGWAPPCPF